MFCCIILNNILLHRDCLVNISINKSVVPRQVKMSSINDDF